MLSPQLRNKVHSLWSLFWTAGISNPLAAIEQITYLLFIRQLESLDRERVKAGKASIYGPRELGGFSFNYEVCRWTNIRENPSFSLLNDTVFPWLRGLEEWLKQQSTNGDDRLTQVTSRLGDAYFILDTNKTETLSRAISQIDDLFRHLDTRSVNADIMGDIFEHLLEEVKESGKNGQFRTPRHVIRFMAELLNPELGKNVLDPACGSAGFLLNTLLHWKAQHTDQQVLKLEWDGTPHNLHPNWPDGNQPDFNACIKGYDNDRTMVRIAWMNLLLHGLENPAINQLDSLSKRLENGESGSYDYILANPPFTGSVDEDDLSDNRQRFPAGKGKKPITNKSELLFVWLILDLLAIGGRAAVIVPDGVLFGNTLAHRALRRQLLFDNTLEAVVSIPANMFQPYSGVKTSILIFQKAQIPDETFPVGEPPRTQEVWFYEIEDEAYTLDQKRKPRFGRDNDLWDALKKFQAWKNYLDGQAETQPEQGLKDLREAATSASFWQPEYWEERWRSVDDEFLRIFPEKEADKGHTYALHELWPELPVDPREADASIAEIQRVSLDEIFSPFINQAVQVALAAYKPPIQVEKIANLTLQQKISEKAAKDLSNRLIRLIRDEKLLDRDYDQFGFNALRPLLDEIKKEAAISTWEPGDSNLVALLSTPDVENRVPKLCTIAREFAKLDGYNVWRRSVEVKEHPGKRRTSEDGSETRVPAKQSWIVPVRVWAVRETWGADPETGAEILKPTHDETGLVLQDYLDWLRDTLKIFEDDGTVSKDHLDRLDPECLEAWDFNLSAGRHKPFSFDAGEHRPPAELIAELDGIYGEIRQRLGRLLDLVEGVE